MSDVLPLSEIQNFGNWLDNAESRIKASGQRGLRQAANIVFIEAQKFVPVRTGALRASGAVTAIDTGDYDVDEVVISYGNAAVDYAEIKHEDPRNGHWLENAMVNKQEEALNVIASAIHGEL